MAYCGKCGNEVSSTAAFCTKCGAPVHSQAGAPYPNYNQPNNPYQSSSMRPGINPSTIMTWSILNTIFCCLPLGIAGIVNANKAKNLPYEEAQKTLEQARTLCIIGTVVGFIVEVIYVAVLVLNG